MIIDPVTGQNAGKSSFRINDVQKTIIIINEELEKLRNIYDILQTKLVKRGLSIKILDAQTMENALGGNVRQVFNLRKGLTQELAKKIVSDIKDSKLKVQADRKSVV